MNKRFYQGAAILLALLTFCSSPANPAKSAAGYKRNHTITVIVRSSPNAAYESAQNMYNAKLEQALRKARQEMPVYSPSLTDIYIMVSQNGNKRIYRLEQSGNLWDEEQGKRFVLPGRLSKKLLHQAKRLRSRHYGELIPWEQADPIVPRKSFFSIQDVETGLTFRVQRRAGSDHADVQPLTKDDTRIMKQIYNGRWSWNRKAILVLSNGRRMAASMNGMPHGGDGIPDNDFSGHFCIHFFNSTTHRSDEPNLAHQLMVHKAAGALRDFLSSASPITLAQGLVQAMNHRDSEMVRLLLEGMETEKSVSIIRGVDSLESIRMTKKPVREQKENLYDAELSLEVELQQKGRGKQLTEFQFILKRQTLFSPWQIQEVKEKAAIHGMAAAHDQEHRVSSAKVHAPM